MHRTFGIVAAALTLLSSGYFAVKYARAWAARGWGRHEPFEDFAKEVEAAIPPTARVRLVYTDGCGGGKYGMLLNARLHPRVVVLSGPADWIVEFPAEKFDRSRASFRRAEP